MDGTRNKESDDVESSEVEADCLYRALSVTRRRRLLALLLAGEQRTVEELATLLAGWEGAETEQLIRPREREKIHIELRHVHLPLLAEAGLVRYDSEAGTVSIEPLADPVVELIRRSVDSE